MTPPRRHDLDWIRVGAFLLLILYHVGMFYVPWDWHVKSPRLVPELEPAMRLLNPWRLTLLFLVSGAASRFLFDRMQQSGNGATRRFALSRTLRLLPPLLCAVFVIVPPQAYYEVYEALQQQGVAAPADAPWLQNFYLRYLTATGRWCDADGCLITPTWNHMWFVAYLLAYTLGLAGLMGVAAPHLPLWQRGLESGLRGWRVLAWPILWLAALQLVLAPLFPVTHAFYDDWYNHALSFGAFTFGFLFARSNDLRDELARVRLPALLLGLAAWVATTIVIWAFRQGTLAPSDAWRYGTRIAYAVQQWGFIAAVLGYGTRYLNHDAPLLRYLTVGIFPFYVVHQTIIVIAGHHLATVKLPLLFEAGLLIAVTFAGCWVAYEAARRIGWLGIVLGVHPQPTKIRPAGV